MALDRATVVVRFQALLSSAILFFCCLPFCCCQLAWGEDEEEQAAVEAERQQISQELSRIKLEISREEGRYRELQTREAGIGQELSQIEDAVSKVREERRLLKDKIEEIGRNVDRLKIAIASSSLRLEEHQKDLRERIIAMYKTRKRLSSLDYLFKATSATDLLKRAYYLSRVAAYDREQLGMLAERLLELQKNENELRDLQRSEAEALIRAEGLNKELEKKKLAKAALLREQREKTALKEKTLTRLKSSAAEIESALSRLMGSDALPEIPPQKPSEVAMVSAKAAASVEKPKKTPQAPSIKFDGKGLKVLSGKLPFPVDGRVVQKFGKRGHEEFSDVLFSKGLEVSAPTGGEVRAVAAGRVIFSNTLPGYGHVIILDHGYRYYTLYGRLAVAQGRNGDIVQQGQIIARLGEQDAQGKNFYFELRVRGKATDPARFFSSMPL
jgi:septal ring factor EnvC (AmiA/AmiB activator)